MTAAAWNRKESPEAREGHEIAAVRCALCNAASGLRLVDGGFLCRDQRACELRQQGYHDDEWNGYDRDWER